MSYYSWVNLEHISNKIDIKKMDVEFRKFLDGVGVHHDVIKNISVLFDAKPQEAMIKLYGNYIEFILLWISKQNPGVSFRVRGRGEGEHDKWTREFKDGSVVSAEGPPEGAW